MAQAYKIEEVKQLRERLENAKSIVLIDYKGINIEEVNELRRRFREAKVDYFISKNTFIKIALNELGITALDNHLEGPTAVATSEIDEVAPAREFVNFVKDVMSGKEFPNFKVGLVSGDLFDDTQLKKLAELPGKEVLLSMVLQGFNAPMTGLVGVLQSILRKFVYTVDAVAKKENN